jgi:hypothetical protein
MKQIVAGFDEVDADDQAIMLATLAEEVAERVSEADVDLPEEFHEMVEAMRDAERAYQVAAAKFGRHIMRTFREELQLSTPMPLSTKMAANEVSHF